MMLTNKIALVTGGARGIGAGIATVMARQGATVVIADLDGEEAANTAASLATPGLGIGADVATAAGAAAVIATAIQKLGGLDILVNNAGAGRGPVDPHMLGGVQGGHVEDMAVESWDEQLGQNLRTTFLVSQAAIPEIRKRGGGAIINIASIAGLVASPTLPAYAAAKAGVISLTKSLALELAPADIRVNAICPGFLWTRAWQGLATGLKMTVPHYSDADPRDIFLEVVKRGVPMGREQTPEDIGELAAFLSSDAAHNITGQWIAVDGGITLRQ